MKSSVLALLTVCTFITLSPASAAPLQCKPISSKDSGLPVICHSEIFREELLTYLNVSDHYLLEAENDQSRWVDRIELISDQSENKILIGNNAITLQINAFLRIRDMKELFASIKSRMNLIRASSETFTLLKELASRKDLYTLNLQIDLKQFLDAPFLGSGGQIISSEVIANHNEQPSSSTFKMAETWRAKTTEAISAVGDKDCVDFRKQMTEEKNKIEAQIDDLNKAKTSLEVAENLIPESPLNLEKGETLTLKADAMSTSDCDQCNEAVYFCKARGTLKGYTPTAGNCKAIFETKSCYRSLPQSMAVPVDLCLGVKLNTTRARIQKSEEILQSKLKNLKTRLNESCAIESENSTKL